MLDVRSLKDDELQSLIDNHRRRGATDRPLYSSAITEWHHRNAGALDLDCTIAFLRKAASEQRFVSYGEVAEANGASWDQVRYPMNAHLWVLVDHAKRMGWPMLSRLVVNKQHVNTGRMDPSTQKGFIAAARALGYVVTDEKEFLARQQQACFDWGASSVPSTDPL